jgi:hypothetical protein
MGMKLLQTLFSDRAQPLHQQVTTMWIYLGPSCPDHPFSKELGDAEINTPDPQGPSSWGRSESWGQHHILEGRGRQHSGKSVCIHLHQFVQFELLIGLVSACKVLPAYAHSTPRGVTLLKNAARREANHAHNEQLWVRRQRRQAWSAP